MPIPIEILKNSGNPELEQALRRHYFERITVPGRFTPESIQALLQDMRRFDSNFSIKENLMRAIERIPLDTLPNLLANVI